MRLVLIDDNGKELPVFELRAHVTDLIVIMPPAGSLMHQKTCDQIATLFADAGVRGVVVPVHVQIARIEQDDTASDAS